MWLASIVKTAATISAVLLVAGITWAVEGGSGNAKSSATAGTKTDLAVVTPKAEAAKNAIKNNRINCAKSPGKTLRFHCAGHPQLLTRGQGKNAPILSSFH